MLLVDILPNKLLDALRNLYLLKSVVSETLAFVGTLSARVNAVVQTDFEPHNLKARHTN